MNRNLIIRKLRKRLQVWQGAAVAVGAMLLMGAGVAGVTASSLFVNAEATSGDKVVVRVGSTEVFKVSHDGTNASVTIDPGAGGTVNISQASINGTTGSIVPTGALVYSTSSSNATLLSAGYTRAPHADIESQNGTSRNNAPSARTHHTAVWNGSEMVVYGGLTNTGYTDTGGTYDPLTDTWTPFVIGGVAARAHHTAVYDNGVMVVWGGFDGTNYLNTGFRRDNTGLWSSTQTTGAPSARAYHAATVLSGKMYIVGGFNGNTAGLNDCYSYDIATDTWSLEPSLANGRYHHTATVVGAHIVVFGGQRSGSFIADTQVLDTSGPSWAPSTNQPPARSGHTAVRHEYSQTVMVWGGENSGGQLAAGNIYDPLTNSWTAMLTTGQPSVRARHSAVWAGDRITVFGGDAAGGYFNSGGSFVTPSAWVQTPLTGAPDGRSGHTVVWTGNYMVVWGGSNSSGHLDTGGRYSPALDRWIQASMYAYQAP